MNTSPINFEFNTNGVNNTIRVIEIEGEPWFVSADALNAMGYPRDGHKMIRKKLGDNEKGVKRIATLGGPQNTSIISESGLYKLVMRSDKPEARAFQDWVTGNWASLSKPIARGLQNTASLLRVVSRARPSFQRLIFIA